MDLSLSKFQELVMEKGSLAYYGPQGPKELDTTLLSNWTELNWFFNKIKKKNWFFYFQHSPCLQGNNNSSHTKGERRGLRQSWKPDHVQVGEVLASTRMSKMHPPALYKGFPGGTSGKNPPANAGEIRDMGLIPGLGRSPGGRHGNPLQDSCQENPMDDRPGRL